MEYSFRGFIEECDNPQGVQVSFDTETFGSFVLAMLERVHDDLPKKSILGFPFFSVADYSADQSEVRDIKDNRMVCSTKPFLQDCLYDIHSN